MADKPSDNSEKHEVAEDVPVTEETISVFHAALEKKKAAGQARSAHLDGHGKASGATSNQKTSRQFRRKSGSS